MPLIKIFSNSFEWTMGDDSRSPSISKSSDWAIFSRLSPSATSNVLSTLSLSMKVTRILEIGVNQPMFPMTTLPQSTF